MKVSSIAIIVFTASWLTFFLTGHMFVSHYEREGGGRVLCEQDLPRSEKCVIQWVPESEVLNEEEI